MPLLGSTFSECDNPVSPSRVETHQEEERTNPNPHGLSRPPFLCSHKLNIVRLRQRINMSGRSLPVRSIPSHTPTRCFFLQRFATPNSLGAPSTSAPAPKPALQHVDTASNRNVAAGTCDSVSASRSTQDGHRNYPKKNCPDYPRGPPSPCPLYVSAPAVDTSDFAPAASLSLFSSSDTSAGLSTETTDPPPTDTLCCNTVPWPHPDETSFYSLSEGTTAFADDVR